jgi:DNA-binding CsgD family transcriptional regulator
VNSNHLDKIIKLHSKNIFYSEAFHALSKSSPIKNLMIVTSFDVSLFDRELYHAVVLTGCNPYVICQTLLNLGKVSKWMEHSILVLIDDMQPWFLTISDNTNLKIVSGKISTTDLISTLNKWIIGWQDTEYTRCEPDYIGLTRQEVITLSTYMRVKSMKKVSMILNVSTKTSYSHRSSAVLKLGFKNVHDFINNGGKAFSDFFDLQNTILSSPR